MLNFIFKGANERSIKAKQNILEMLFYKGGAILIGILLLPLTIHYVDSENYGIWLTLSSMVAWMSFFDIGINNGLKNKLAEAFAADDLLLQKKYVSTAYAILIIIFIPLMILFAALIPYMDWKSILNLSMTNNESLSIVFVILIVYFCLNFILSTINAIFNADQRPAQASLLSFVQQLFTLVAVAILTITTEGSLIKLSVALCVCPLAVNLFFNIYIFKGRYRKISPSFSFIDLKVAPALLKLGFQFFIIQIAGIVQYQMINFLILRFYGANDVTSYNVAHKYFNVIALVWGILISPLWVAVTDALARNDTEWIINAVKRYSKTYLLFFIVGIFMLAISSYIYRIWVGDGVFVTFELSTFVLIYNLAIMAGSIFVYVVNGSGELKWQTYACLVSPFVFIGVFYLCHYYFNFGVISVVMAAIISNFNGLIIAPFQCYHIISKHYCPRKSVNNSLKRPSALHF